MTNILLITNKGDVTTDFIVKKLQEKKVLFYRFNTDELTKSTSISLNIKTDSFKLFDSVRNLEIELKQFTAVYFRRPELPVIENPELNAAEIKFLQNEIAFTLEGIYKILDKAYWLSPVYAIRQTENKIYQLMVARSLDFLIPDSLISNLYNIAKQFYIDSGQKCIIKPIKSGLIEDQFGSRVIFTSSLDKFPEESQEIETCPHFFQNEINKKADVRVTMVGNAAFATLIHSQERESSRTDWRNSETPLRHSRYDLPEPIKQKCIELLKLLGLRFGAIDFIIDEYDNFVFLEINPNGQWAWIETQTGYQISDEIVNLLCNESF